MSAINSSNNILLRFKTKKDGNCLDKGTTHPLQLLLEHLIFPHLLGDGSGDLDLDPEGDLDASAAGDELL